jgi:hypothetical protein
LSSFGNRPNTTRIRKALVGLRRFVTRSVLRGAIWSVLVLVLASCASAKGPTSQSPSVTAVPNPVPAGDGLGTTRISWTTGNGSLGQVYVSEDGAEEKLFAEGPEGAMNAGWIASAKGYEFRLYDGDQRSRVLASVKVTRNDR